MVRIARMSILAMPRFFAKMLQMCKHNTVKCFWPLIACRLKVARARTPRHDPSLSPFRCWIMCFASGVMQVDGAGLDLGVESVLVEEDCAPTIMVKMKSLRNIAVVDVISRLLKGNDVPLACVCVSSPRSWVPIVDTETFLFG